MKTIPHNKCISMIIKYLDERVKGHSKCVAQKNAGIDCATHRYLKRYYSDYTRALLIFKNIDHKRQSSFYPKE